MIFCSIAGANHLSYSMALAKSVKRNIKNSKFVLCLLENDIHSDAKDYKYFDKIVLAKDLGVPNFTEFILKYNIYESACALKPFLLLHLFNKNWWGQSKFVYLDSDIRVYGPFNEMNEVLDKYAIVLTPHRLEPQEILNSIDEEIVNLKDGVYQAGVIGVNSTSKESKRFLQWWASRCYEYCNIDYYKGLYLDQKWLNLVPCFFNDVYTLTHPGYNMASWNLAQRSLEKVGPNKYIVNKKDQLQFFHFSGMYKWLHYNLDLHVPDKNNDIYKLITDYENEYEALNHSKYKDTPWSYDKHAKFEKIIVSTNELQENLTEQSKKVEEVPFNKIDKKDQNDVPAIQSKKKTESKKIIQSEYLKELLEVCAILEKSKNR